jgi:predicted dienelactone hydrolase
MRLFENLILLTLLFALAWSLLPARRRPRLTLYMPALALALIAVHAFYEGLRWQMIPAYLMTLALGLISLRRLRGSARPEVRRSPLVRLLGVLFILFLFIIVSQLPALLPVFSLPEPNGQYAVGTFSLVLNDPERPETFTADSSDHRQVPLQIWYPAEVQVGGKPLNYWLGRNEMSRILAKEMGLPFFLLDHLALVKSHSYESAPPEAALPAYPVLIFSHGYHLGYLQQNLAVMETLASHGYIVISLAHPYEALAAPLADGNLALYARELEEEFYASPTKQEESLAIWAADFERVLDSLEPIQSGEIPTLLAGRLDLKRVGLFGMSFGGSAAALVCLEDERCQALLTLDSPQYGAVEAGQIDQPVMFIAAVDGQYIERGVYEAARGPAYLATVQGAVHHNFSDLSLISPLSSALGVMGPIDGGQMVRIMNAYTLAFYDRHLRDLPGALLNGSSAEFPEVHLEARNAP